MVKSLLTVLFLAMFLWGCAISRAPAPHTPAEGLQYPPPPLPAKLIWVKEVRQSSDMGITPGLLTRMVRSITGARETKVVKPYGVLGMRGERLFIADTGGGVVHFMDGAAGRYRILGQNAQIRLLTPVGLTEDDAQRLYITDATAHAVYRYDLQTDTLIPFITAGLRRPTGIAFNRSNRLLYVTDTAAHQVVVYDLEGGKRFSIGGRGEAPGFFNYPTDLFIDGRGDLYVTDSLNHRVQILTADGKPVTHFGQAGDRGGYMPKAKGIAVDSQGHIYLADALLHAVQIFDRQGHLLLDIGGAGTAPGEFWMPSGLHIDDNDYLYVADSYNQRVQIFRFVGEETPVPDEAPQEAIKQ